MTVDGETERVIGLFVDDLSVYGDFLADFGGEPESFGFEAADRESFTSTSAAAGVALAQYVGDLQGRCPAWATVDVERVDWPTVSQFMERRLLQQIGLGGIV